MIFYFKHIIHKHVFFYRLLKHNYFIFSKISKVYNKDGQIAAREPHAALVIIVYGSRSYLQKPKYFNFLHTFIKKKMYCIDIRI
jgi:hypothetical protein